MPQHQAQGRAAGACAHSFAVHLQHILPRRLRHGGKQLFRQSLLIQQPALIQIAQLEGKPRFQIIGRALIGGDALFHPLHHGLHLRPVLHIAQALAVQPDLEAHAEAAGGNDHHHRAGQKGHGRRPASGPGLCLVPEMIGLQPPGVVGADPFQKLLQPPAGQPVKPPPKPGQQTAQQQKDPGHAAEKRRHHSLPAPQLHGVCPHFGQTAHMEPEPHPNAAEPAGKARSRADRQGFCGKHHGSHLEKAKIQKMITN